MGRAWSWLGGMVGALLLAGCSTTASATDASSADAGSVDRGAPVDLDAGLVDRSAPVDLDAGMVIDDGPARPDVPPLDDGGAPSEDRPDVPPPDDRGAPSEDRPDVPVAEDVPGPTCATPTELRNGDVLRGQRFGAAPSQPSMCSGPSVARLPTLWYRATIPAGEVMVVRAVEEGGDRTRFPMFVTPDCDASECLATVGAEIGGFNALRYRNETGAPRTVLVGVAQLVLASGTTENNPVTVSARITALAANSVCTAATPLTPGVTLRGQDLGTADFRRICPDGPVMRSIVQFHYSITVPPRTSLSVVAEHETPPNFFHLLEVWPPCGTSTTCVGVASATSSVPGTRNPVVRYDNPTAEPRPMIVNLTQALIYPVPVLALTATLQALP